MKHKPEKPKPLTEAQADLIARTLLDMTEEDSDKTWTKEPVTPEKPAKSDTK